MLLSKYDPEFVMTDSFGRRMRKMRLSLLDACNFRCVYCMPENPKFLSEKELLPTTDLIEIAGNFIRLGVEEIRLTGGEPTLRKDLVQIAEGLSKYPLKKLALTSNAYRLKEHLAGLKNTNLNSMNISLDSLNDEKFARITRDKSLKIVLDNIFLAQDMGFKIKINAVAMKGVNDDEIGDFIDFSKKHQIEVRFLECMNIGVARPYFKQWFISAKDMMQKISQQYELEPVSVEKDSTSFVFDIPGGGRIGFIASESQAFCSNCSRLRLDAKGVLRPCLFKEEGLSFAGLSFDEYPEKIKQVLKLKPMDRIPELKQPMYQVGG